MAAEPYLITGRKGTGVHDRLDIEDLQSGQPQQFTLFVLAFLALQGRGDAFEGLDIPPAARFYELAAIHGLPFTVRAWDVLGGIVVLMDDRDRSGLEIILAAGPIMTPRTPRTASLIRRALEA